MEFPEFEEFFLRINLVKVKQYLCRPVQAPKALGGCDFQKFLTLGI